MGRPKWQSADLKEIIPDAVTELANSIATPLNAIASAMGTVNSALETAKTLIVAFPAFDIATALAILVQNFKKDLENTGVFFLPMWDAGLVDFLIDHAKAAAANFDDPQYSDKVKQFWEARYRGAVDDFNQLLVPLESGAAFKAKLAEVFGPKPDFDVAFGNVGNSWSNFIVQIINSLDDLGDPNRPQFGSDPTHPELGGAAVRAIVFVVGAPTLEEFVGIMANLKRLFPDLTDLQKTFCAYNQLLLQGVDKLWGYPEEWPQALLDNPECVPQERKNTLLGIPSTPPDWRSLQLKHLAPFNVVFEIVDNLMSEIIALLKVGSNAKEALIRLISAIQLKVKQLEEVAQRLADLITRITDILGATGIYTLYIEASGNTDLKQKLLTADVDDVAFAKPAPAQGGKTQDAFLSGCVFLAGGPNVTGFDLFFKALQNDSGPDFSRFVKAAP